jgi:putative membrane-bound dehydrogenase-like protein
MNCLSKILLFLFVLSTGISCKEQRYPGPLAAEEALKHFQLRKGFKIDLFAAEPHVMDPIEMVFDEQGNVFVTEMPDYPFMPEQEKGAGRIRLLRDTNSDGMVDENVIFADSILEVTSMLPWKGGLIVTAAPHILYLQDTDGDFRADKKEVLFSGFFENNSEAQITSLRMGIDNWIYAANNGQAGTVHFTGKPDAPALNMSGADFRFRLDRGEFELETGGAQFGLTMDDWGHRFITQNTLHIRQPVIPWRYLNRHSHVAAGSAVVNISDHELEMFQQTPPPYWRAERTRRRQIQYKEQNLDREEYAEDHFTGCSGGTVYDGDAFPAEYYGNVFTGDVAGNLIHRDVVVPLDDRPTFAAKRAEGEQKTEFLASTDSWFRPSSFAVGPDGFLYVVDMYRQHIETPLSIPEDLKEDMNFLAGSDRGRIYRIRPDSDEENRAASPGLRDKTSADLVQLLPHPNRWWRLQAQRLLLERQDLSVVPAVKNLFSQHEYPRARIHAFYVLEGLNALDVSLVKRAMEDEHFGVRKHGLILSERHPELRKMAIEMLNDSSIHVVFQATLSIGGGTDNKTIDALARVLSQHGDDPLFRIAVLSANAGPRIALFHNLIKKNAFFETPAPWKEAWLAEFSYSVGSANKAGEVRSFLDMLQVPAMSKQPQWQLAAVNGLKKGLVRSSGADADLKQTLENIPANSTDQVPQAIEDLRNLNAKNNSL